MRTVCWLIVFILIYTVAFSQDESRILPFIPGASQRDKLEKAINAEKGALKNSGYYNNLSGFITIRENEANEERCLVEGRCDMIKNAPRKEICLALKSGSCNSLLDWKKNYCLGLLEGNFNLLYTASKSREFIRYMGELNKGDVGKLLAVYAAFKYHNILDCERYTKDAPLSSKLSCKILLSVDPMEQIETLLYDLALFNIAKHKSDTNLCNYIKDNNIKKSCLKSSVNNLQEIW